MDRNDFVKLVGVAADHDHDVPVAFCVRCASEQEKLPTSFDFQRVLPR
jgi:hypothetical protein